MGGTFVLPFGGKHPPALSVVEQLQAVDAALKDRPVGLDAGLVRTEYVGNVAELLCDAVDLFLVEAAPDEGGIGAIHELLVRDGLRLDLAVTRALHRHKADIRDVEAAVTRPLARLSRRAGDD